MTTRNIYKFILPLGLTLAFAACKIEPIEDPNNPSVGGITQNASLSEIQNLVTGMEAGMRLDLDDYYVNTGVIGREFYRFSASDPRFTSDLLGKGLATLDNNTFYTTNPYTSRYRVVKNANLLLEAITNTTAAVTDNQRQAARGFANTIKAYQLLQIWVLQYDNGVRIDVADPDNLGGFVGENDQKATLRAIIGLLDEGHTQLQAAGSDAFPFELSAGFEGFDTPETFDEFNRALAARVQLYNENWQQSLDALNASFFDLMGDFNDGVYHLFSTAGGDELNPVYYSRDAEGETIVVHNSFVADAEAGDDRLSKAAARTAAAFQDDLTSDYDFTVYSTNTSPIAIIRNEELILIYAEANAQLGNTSEAVAAIDVIRTAHGLSPYSGATDLDSLIDEILRQRRYSLFGEGHRWVDLRRYDRLDELPIDRVGDDVWTKFPRPANED
jgi:hypothetical protein